MAFCARSVTASKMQWRNSGLLYEDGPRHFPAAGPIDVAVISTCDTSHIPILATDWQVWSVTPFHYVPWRLKKPIKNPWQGSISPLRGHWFALWQSSDFFLPKGKQKKKTVLVARPADWDIVCQGWVAISSSFRWLVVVAVASLVGAGVGIDETPVDFHTRRALKTRSKCQI